MLNSWSPILDPPISDRRRKPRNYGLTMILDKGLTLLETKEWLELTEDYIDLIKLTFGTSALYPEANLREKIRMIREKDIGVFPGGTLLEIAIYQGKARNFLSKAFDLGFNYLEISDGTIPLDLRTRGRIIELAKEKEFTVITEVGKKSPQENLNTGLMLQIAKFDLDHGASLVIVEGRESGKGVGIYDQNGAIEDYRLEFLLENLPQERILWETPLKQQQVDFIKRFGANVNLGNIAPQEVYALECLRLGLRGDTLLNAIKSENIEDAINQPS